MAKSTDRWRVVLGVSVALVAVGLWTLTPGVLVAAMIPLGYIAYSVFPSAVAADDQLAVTRSVTPTQTHPGGTVSVELEIEHRGEKPLTDLRVIDGVPDPLPVIDGSPRASLSLQSEDTVTVEYTLRVRSGEFEFSAARARTTSLSGARVSDTDINPDGDTQVTAQLNIADFAPSEQTTRMVGSLASDRGGEGVEFYGTREYRASDPANHINWREYAETRELTTVNYQQPKAVEVIVIVDARQPAAIAASDTSPTGVELDVYAASEAVDGLVTARNRVGLVTLGVGNDTGGGFGWIPPGNGHSLRNRVRTQLNLAAATAQSRTTNSIESESAKRESAAPAAGSEVDTESAVTTDGARGTATATDEIADLLNPRTQVILFSPLCDEQPVEISQQLQAAGYRVSVCTPDITASSTAGSTLAGIDRSLRLASLRASGATVIDWSHEDPLALVLERTATTLTTGPRSYS